MVAANAAQQAKPDVLAQSHPDNTGNRKENASPIVTNFHKELEDDHEAASPDSLEQSLDRPLALDLSLPREILFVLIVCLAQVATQAGLGQTLFILPVLGKSFGLTHSGELAWLIAGYSLTVGTFILPSGRLGDMFGYKRMVVIGFSWFAVWSLVAGLSIYSTHVLFVFARVLQGIGPAIIMPNALALLGASYPPGPRKNLVFALFGACAPGTPLLPHHRRGSSD